MDQRQLINTASWPFSRWIQHQPPYNHRLNPAYYDQKNHPISPCGVRPLWAGIIPLVRNTQLGFLFTLLFLIVDFRPIWVPTDHKAWGALVSQISVYIAAVGFSNGFAIAWTWTERPLWFWAQAFMIVPDGLLLFHLDPQLRRLWNAVPDNHVPAEGEWVESRSLVRWREFTFLIFCFAFLLSFVTLVRCFVFRFSFCVHPATRVPLRPLGREYQ